MSDLLPKPKTPANGMPALVIEKFDRCNTCAWAVLDVLRAPGAIICHGVPPTPVMLGMTAQGPQVDALRPVLREDSRACSLHKKKLILNARDP